MLDNAQRAAIQAALGYLLDEEQAAAAADPYGEEREHYGPWDDSEESWLESKTGCTADELRRAAFELAHPQTVIASPSDSDLVAAAQQLNENLPDSLPQTDDIRSRADVEEQLRTVQEHAAALARLLGPDAGEPRFTVSDWTNADGSVSSCVVDNAQVGSDGERLILARDVDEPTAETIREALELSLIPAAPESSRRGWLIPAPWDGPELKLDPAAESGGPEPRVPAASRALFVLRDAAELVESEPGSGDPEAMLARVLLATGALFAAGQGTLSQCYRTAAVWERG